MLHQNNTCSQFPVMFVAITVNWIFVILRPVFHYRLSYKEEFFPTIKATWSKFSMTPAMQKRVFVGYGLSRKLLGCQENCQVTLRRWSLHICLCALTDGFIWWQPWEENQISLYENGDTPEGDSWVSVCVWVCVGCRWSLWQLSICHCIVDPDSKQN